MGAVTILSITTLLFITFSLIVIFISLKSKLNEIKKGKKIVFIFLEIIYLSLINNVNLVDGINIYKRNKLSIEKNKLESNTNIKNDISPLTTEFEDKETLVSSDKNETFYFKNTSETKGKENNEVN